MRRKVKRNKLQQLRASVMRVHLKLKQILLRTSFSSLLLVVVHVASCTVPPITFWIMVTNYRWTPQLL